MFDLFDEIEEKYLWNFTEKEKKSFREEQAYNRKLYTSCQVKLMQLIATDSPAIFSDDSYMCPISSPFELRYTFNRLSRNDPREKELYLSFLDPIFKDSYYTNQIVSGLRNNTSCSRVILKGVRLQNGRAIRSFNDDEAGVIIDTLSDKKLSEFTFSHAPLLTDRTFQRIASLSIHPDNQWAHVTLGDIVVDDSIANMLRASQKVSFTQISNQPQKPCVKDIFSRLFEKVRTV